MRVVDWTGKCYTNYYVNYFRAIFRAAWRLAEQGARTHHTPELERHKSEWIGADDDDAMRVSPLNMHTIRIFYSYDAHGTSAHAVRSPEWEKEREFSAISMQ